MSQQWKCPACHAGLFLDNNQLRCENNHSYDIAKEGYVNLLLANQKRSKEPGDNKAMINARRGFLEQGYYQPLADKLAALIEAHIPTLLATSQQRESINVFDAGCGEGYYLNQILLNLQERLNLKEQQENQEYSATNNASSLKVNGSGCDIAKVAIQKAAKKYRQCRFAVASTFHLPVSDNSQHAVVQVFAPASAAEVQRVLHTNGLWLQVNPAPEHLRELKAMVYNTAQQHETKAVNAPHFQTLYDETLTFEINFRNNEDKANLLMMTPFYWSASEQAKQQIADNLHSVTCHFHIQVLRHGEASSETH